MYNRNLASKVVVDFNFTKDQRIKFDWRVTVYDRNGIPTANWRLNDMTDREAEKEASSAIDRMTNVDDWVLDPILRRD